MTRATGARRGWETRREREQAAEREVLARDPSFFALWEREKARFKGTPEVRAERFLEYALANGSEVEGALVEWSERKLVADLAPPEDRCIELSPDDDDVQLVDEYQGEVSGADEMTDWRMRA